MKFKNPVKVKLAMNNIISLKNLNEIENSKLSIMCFMFHTTNLKLDTHDMIRGKVFFILSDFF